MTFDHPRWWEFQLGPQTPEPTDVGYTCDAKLGNPGLGSCESVLYEFLRGGNVMLDPDSGPIIKTSGDCAIGISTKARQLASWDSLRKIAEALIVQCVASPIATAAGGTAVAKLNRGRRKRSIFPLSSLYLFRRDATNDSSPASIHMALYLQPPFSGAATATCAWKVASTHQGDVKQCPVTSPFRPPERELSSSEIVIHDRNITEIVNATAAEFISSNTTEVLVGNMTRLLENLENSSTPETPTTKVSRSTIVPSASAPLSMASATASG